MEYIQLYASELVPGDLFFAGHGKGIYPSEFNLVLSVEPGLTPVFHNDIYDITETKNIKLCMLSPDRGIRSLIFRWNSVVYCLGLAFESAAGDK